MQYFLPPPKHWKKIIVCMMQMQLQLAANCCLRTDYIQEMVQYIRDESDHTSDMTYNQPVLVEWTILLPTFYAKLS